jgi:hypothetical protein
MIFPSDQDHVVRSDLALLAQPRPSEATMICTQHPILVRDNQIPSTKQKLARPPHTRGIGLLASPRHCGGGWGSWCTRPAAPPFFNRALDVAPHNAVAGQTPTWALAWSTCFQFRSKSVQLREAYFDLVLYADAYTRALAALSGGLSRKPCSQLAATSQSGFASCWLWWSPRDSRGRLP